MLTFSRPERICYSYRTHKVTGTCKIMVNVGTISSATRDFFFFVNTCVNTYLVVDIVRTIDPEIEYFLYFKS